MIYDIIGDIHGQADKLINLLKQLGYEHDGICFIPPANHRTIFIGDFVDRGQQEVKTLETVFAMLDAGVADAVMGNHEYNAIAYATLNEMTDDGSYLRSHSPTHDRQHEAFLAEVPFGSDEHKYWIQRFYELPLWLELDTACFVHACWDTDGMHKLANCVDENNCLTFSGMQKTGQKDTPEYMGLERVLKGVESVLPDGIHFIDKGGTKRQNVRIKWWMPNLQERPISELAKVSANSQSMLDKLPRDLGLKDLNFTITTDKPIFIGHYWFTGTPAPLSEQVVCVDYSAAVDSGYLTCYQFDTECPNRMPLSADNFVQYIPES